MATRNLQKLLLTLKRQKEFVEKLEHWAETLVIFAAEMKKSENKEYEMVRDEMNCHLRDLALDVLTLKKRCNRAEDLAVELSEFQEKPKGEKSLDWASRRTKSMNRDIDGRIVVTNDKNESYEF